MRYDIVIGCGLLAAGAAIASYFHCMRAKPVVVNVKGVAEKVVKADRGTLRIAITDRAATLDELYEKRKRSESIVADLLKKNHIDEKEISIDTNVYFLDATYNTQTGKVQSEAYYQDNIVYFITTDKISSIEALNKSQDELLEKNINATFSVEYKIKDFYAQKSQLVKEATKNAVDTAREMLEQTGAKLGELNGLTQGTISIQGEDAMDLYNANEGPFLYKRLRLVVQASFKKK